MGRCRKVHCTECIVLRVIRLIRAKWIRLILSVGIPLMEVCLHVLLRQGAETGLCEFDVLGHLLLEERM